MHPAEKKAILSHLNMLEQSVRELRALIVGSDGDQTPPPAAAMALNPIRNPVHYPNQLTDEEDRDLEDMMESNRLALLKESESLMQRFYSDEPQKSASGDFYSEDDQ